MAISHNEVQVTWDTGNNEDTITGEANVTSDPMTLSTTAIARTVHLKAEMTTGTPTSGDKTYFYMLGSCGDPDGAGDDEYATDDSDGTWLATVDHNAGNPGRPIVCLPVPLKRVKIYAKTTGLDGGDVVTVSACILEAISS
jgi:hypothetical protein